MKADEDEVFGDDNKYVSLASDLNTAANFKYSSINVAGPYQPNDPSEIVYSGCECILPSCDQSCPCIQRFGPNYTKEGRCIAANTETSPKSTENITKPVLECNTSCKCGSECINRVVQNGPRFQLQVFKTIKKGFGLRAMEKIPRHHFVCEYAGEILTDEEAKKRTESLTRKDMNYILVVKENISEGKIVRTNIDPTRTGNVGRFINHSCTPNLYQVIVRVDNEIPRVGLFAARDIDELEELCYSYQGGDAHWKQDDSYDENGQVFKDCYCKSPNCRKFLPIDLTLF